MTNLCVVMPLYNEEDSIEKTVNEWLSTLRKIEPSNFNLLLIDDGSKDKSLDIIKKLADNNNEIIIKTGANQGHGKSCFDGYKYAVSAGYDWVLQLDSDGQCDPKYFRKFVELTTSGADCVYGMRLYRKDGVIRYFVSRILSVIALIRTGVWVFDPNVPYRLFKTNCVRDIVGSDPKIELFNVYLALYHKKNYKRKVVSIVFRDRWGGSPSVKVSGLWRWGVRFWKEIEGITF